MRFDSHVLRREMWLWKALSALEKIENFGLLNRHIVINVSPMLNNSYSSTAYDHLKIENSASS